MSRTPTVEGRIVWDDSDGMWDVRVFVDGKVVKVIGIGLNRNPERNSYILRRTVLRVKRRLQDERRMPRLLPAPRKYGPRRLGPPRQKRRMP